MSSEPSWRYAALVSYVGTGYCGWQTQAGPDSGDAPSIQETIEAALRQITSEEKLSFAGSGRTDAGVHATGQVIHFVLKRKHWEPEILQKGLNSILGAYRTGKVSKYIQILGVKEVPVGFHAQRSAVKKQYSYYFQQGPCALPHVEPYSWWIKKELDVKAMQKGLNFLLGKNDFKPFQASGGKTSTTVREILEAEVSLQKIQFPGLTQLSAKHPHLVRVRLVGTGFLKQMVRGIVGTLLQVGEGRREAESFRTILETGDRFLVGPTAPSRALWLEQVWYPDLSW